MPKITENEPALRHVTYEQILDMVGAKTPKTGTSREAWANLKGVCLRLQASETLGTISAGRHWLLKEVSAEGYRGARTRLSLALNPHPGITVIHGANGTGKSTLAEALRSTLWGAVGKSFTGEARRTGSLWRPVEVNKSSSEATIHAQMVDALDFDTTLDFWLEVRIVDGLETLTSRGQLAEKGVTTDISEEARGAFKAALLSAPPVLAYADMANELRDKSHLLSWLTDSLGMGPLLGGIEASIDDASSESADAAKRLEAERKSAQAALLAVDDGAREADLVSASTPVIPTFVDHETRTQWLEDENLLERTKADDSYDAATDELVREFAAELAAAFVDVQKMKDGKGIFFESLRELKSVHEAHSADDPSLGNTCPACGAEGSGWIRHVEDTFLELDEYRIAHAALASLVARAQEELLNPLGRVQRIVEAGDPSLAALSMLRAASDAAAAEIAPGRAPIMESLPGLTFLADFLASVPGAEARQSAILKSDSVHQWHCERWSAISAYLEAWTDLASTAEKAALWKSTKTCCSTVIRAFRDERNKALSDGINTNVAVLLREFGLKINELRLTKHDADFGLVDLNGDDVNLGELSAGQRNALILAPMLATADSSLFGFTLLDDPVHAFDEFRVDHLSEVLARIARGQRLIVTTHDARLVEQLRIHSGKDFDLIQIDRDPTLGAITFENRGNPSAELLRTSAEIIGQAKSKMAGARDWSDVEALLRLAVDEAITSCFLRATLPLARPNRSEKVSALEKIDKLTERFAYLKTHAGLASAEVTIVDSAELLLKGYMNRWNKAIHGNLQDSDLELHEILSQKDAAKDACQRLDGLAR
jgi:energy-coupling factor transporter ATP-binding protein EcfA2